MLLRSSLQLLKKRKKHVSNAAAEQKLNDDGLIINHKLPSNTWREGQDTIDSKKETSTGFIKIFVVGLLDAGWPAATII